jgi:N-methylhydantoinase B
MTNFNGIDDAYVPGPTLTIDPGLPFNHDVDEHVDAITYEVIRHNLWSINEEHGMTILRVSGSPIAAFGCDFNPSIMDETGNFIYFGPYLQFHSGMQDLNVKWVLENRSTNPGIGPDDMFIANDPWVGTCHQQDVMLTCPVFVDGELFCWVANTLHFVDLGGVTAGGWNAAATEVYQEPVPMPPIKIVERGRIRLDIEQNLTRRSRLPESVALDLRAVIAGCSVAKRRILELIDRYGAATVKGVMRRIISDSANTFAERLDAIPDGIWRERGYLEIAVPGDRNVYQGMLTVEKSGDRLSFSNAGTDPQVGAINVTYAGWRGAILSVINPFMTPDLLYAVGGPLQHIDFHPEPGTILSASPPAAVCNGSAIGVEFTISLANNCLARMLHTVPKLRRLYTANNGITAWPIVSVGGKDQRGNLFQNMFLDFYAAPVGAYSFRDGVDTGGVYWGPKQVAPNVEHNEQMMPVLYLRRTELEDSAGAGTHVGGATIAISFTVHKSAEMLHQIATCGVTHPTSTGIFGGMPGPPNVYRFLEGDGDVQTALARRVPIDAHEPGARVLAPKEANLRQRPGDVYEVICSGAAGWGDPLARDPAAVARDVRDLRFSAPEAERTFGVVFAGEHADAGATATRREELLAERLRAATPGRPYDGAPLETLLGEVGGALGLGVAEDGRKVLVSLASGEPLCRVEQNYKEACARLELGVAEAHPQAEDPSAFVDERLVFRLYLCPATGRLIETEVARDRDGVLHEIELRPDTAADAVIKAQDRVAEAV